ncbi:protein particle complex subunit [Coemansia aciculifera]|uniref:Trafficking protein particle complex subunit n=1 Tax=Coemansia aciculifera TaxID=417176 RepID=A0A9W8ILY2_9FUNG|nr:protein particle complex subunit [Coemansia sp. S146]KAJ2865080.1 protein particle complex subunit [Coemansia aciculifera]KAJ2870213.1 protein particle complex subunit [Coemansia aciculifera]
MASQSHAQAQAQMHTQNLMKLDNKTSKRSNMLLEHNVSRPRRDRVGLGAFAFMFAEIIRYSQNRVLGIQDLEAKLSEIGQRVGVRMFELAMWREKTVHRETRVLQTLVFINTVVWRALFDKQADSLERSTESDDEYMITDNEPAILKYISVPKEMSSFSPGAFISGIVEAIARCCQCPARVTSHVVPADGLPLRTVILLKFDKEVMDREKRLEAGK